MNNKPIKIIMLLLIVASGTLLLAANTRPSTKMSKLIFSNEKVKKNCGLNKLTPTELKELKKLFDECMEIFRSQSSMALSAKEYLTRQKGWEEVQVLGKREVKSEMDSFATTYLAVKCGSKTYLCDDRSIWLTRGTYLGRCDASFVEIISSPVGSVDRLYIHDSD